VVGVPSSAHHHSVQPSYGAQLANAHAADAQAADAHAANLPTANVQASGTGRNQPPFGRPVPSGADSWPRFMAGFASRLYLYSTIPVAPSLQVVA
jgi:outer membrane protein TolC